MAKLTKAQKKLLDALATDKGTLVSWPDYGVVFDLRVKADFEGFDGDRRGIAAALIEREFAILRALANDHVADDESDHGTFAASVMVEALIKALPAAIVTDKG